MTALARQRLRELDGAGALSLPLPGGGRTPERLRRLAGLARRETVSVARLAEAHTDAVAILAEAALEPEPDALYGVWASEHGDADATRLDEGTRRISGRTRFCSGVHVVDRALVSAATGCGDRRLVEVDLRPADTLHTTTATWRSPALVDTSTGDVTFRSHPTARLVGPSTWYTTRPGFWDGACGPAACWAGGAIGLVDAVAAAQSDPLRQPDAGAAVVAAWTMLTLLDGIGRDIDTNAADPDRRRTRALAFRHAIDRQVAVVLDCVGRSAGARALTYDGALAQRLVDVAHYVRQHGGARDLVALASDEVAVGTLLGW